MAKIILVEDEINIASFIERGLREFGHEVSVVYDGNAGWELLQNESFDIGYHYAGYERIGTVPHVPAAFRLSLSCCYADGAWNYRRYCERTGCRSG
jgi:hypothetical protein